MVSDASSQPPAPVAHHRPYGRLVGGLVAAALVIAVSWIVVARPFVPHAEELVFRWVNHVPAAWWPVLWPVMQLGNLAAPLVAAGVAAIVWRRWRPVVAVPAGAYVAWGLAQLVKQAVERARPNVLLHDVVLREGTHGLGFVSGHAAVAAAMATTAWPYLRWRGRVVVVVLSLLVGLGRIYAGAHLPLDVVGGAAIGMMAGLVVNGLVGVPHPRPAGDAGTRHRPTLDDVSPTDEPDQRAPGVSRPDS
jgi:undecaprenyl-diphosphatase